MRTLFYSTIFLALVGCSLKLNKKVILRDGLFYEKNSEKLLNGKFTIPRGSFEGIERESKGEIKEGKQTGLWKFYHSNGKLAEVSHWNNNVIDGSITVFYESGKKAGEGNFKDGKQDGLTMEWHENGHKKLKSYFKDGKRNGLLTSWHDNGQIEEQGTFLNGNLHGLTKQWKKNGDLLGEFNSKYGNKHGNCTHYYSNGTKEWVHNYKDGKQDGSSSQWYPSGSKRRESVWKDGKIISCSVWKPNGEKCNYTKLENGDGVVVDYNEEGQVVAKSHFKNGKELAF